ncbi:MAG: hypothetical protein WBG42_18080 [Cryomorphaceae bacterium]
MKRSIFGLLIISILLTSCNDDDENNNPPGGGDPMQPTSGSISATINGEIFNSSNNVARELSYGYFMIRSEADGKSLKFLINDFLGNATYTLTNQTDQNFVEYFVEIDGESIGFESISGELVVTDYDLASKTFNANFNVIFARIGNELITMTAEGTYTGVSIIEMQEPNPGETTIFYLENEYLNFEDSAVRYQDGAVTLNVENTSASSLSMNGSFSNESFNFITIQIGSFDYEFSGNEIIEYRVDTVASVISGHFIDLNSSADVEIWFNDLPYAQSDLFFSRVQLFLGNEIVEFDNGELTISPIGSFFSFLFYAENTAQDAEFKFQNAFFGITSDNLDQILTGRSDLDIISDTQSGFSLVESTMTMEQGSFENTVNVSIDLGDIGTLEALSVPLNQ